MPANSTKWQGGTRQSGHPKRACIGCRRWQGRALRGTSCPQILGAVSQAEAWTEVRRVMWAMTKTHRIVIFPKISVIV